MLLPDIDDEGGIAGVGEIDRVSNEERLPLDGLQCRCRWDGLSSLTPPSGGAITRLLGLLTP
jgi:hypothetical protein